MINQNRRRATVTFNIQRNGRPFTLQSLEQLDQRYGMMLPAIGEEYGWCEHQREK